MIRDCGASIVCFLVDCLQSSHSIQTPNFLKVVVHVIVSVISSDEIQVTVVYSRAIIVAVTSELC